MGKKGVMVYLDPADIKKLEAIEKRTGHNPSAIVRQAVKEFLSKEERKHE